MKRLSRKIAIGVAGGLVVGGLLAVTPIENYPKLGIGLARAYGPASNIVTSTIASAAGTGGATGAALAMGGGGTTAISWNPLTWFSALAEWISNLAISFGL